MADLPTPPFKPSPCVMVVAETLSPLLHEVLDSSVAPVPLLRVRHTQAACERMLSTHPLVVVFVDRPPDPDLQRVTEVVHAVGADLVIVDEFPELELLRERLWMAMIATDRRRSRRPPPSP